MDKKIKINNSYEAAVKSGRWGNPGASLFNKIKDSKTLLNEAYLQVGDADKDTSFSASGCKYPHHTVINGELVVSIPGIKAALSRAKQMGVCSGELKKHLERHYREMGIYKDSALYKEAVIEENFKFIDGYLGINTDVPITESAVTTNDSYKEVFATINTPEELLSWMDCIAYDKALADWSLKHPSTVATEKLGNCHDQSLFALKWFEENEYDCGQLFFIEVNEGEAVGGNTHTLTWYIGIDSKYWWFEHSWENYRGLRGPYNNINDLKDAVYKAWEKDDDINQGNYERIEFLDTPHYSIGMDLAEYVDSWTGNLNEQANWIDRIVWNELFRESVFNEEKDFNYTEEQTEILNELKEFGIEDLWFVKSDDGVDNCCVKVNGYNHPMRGRSSMITLKNENGNWYVLCKQNKDDYGVPGGGWNKDEYPTDAAIRELHEETLSDVTNLSRLGELIEYSDDINGVKQWVKDHVANPDDWWYGYYSQIFVGMYNGKYTGNVSDEDRETGYSWKLVSDVESEFPEEYKEAIHTYLSIDGNVPLNESNLTKEFRYVINEEDGHFIKVVYELNPDNATCADRSTLKTKGDTNYVSKGNKIVALVDMCNNKRLDHVSAFPPIHNIGGNIAPITIKKYLSTLKRFEKLSEDELKKVEDKLKKECPTGIAPSLEFPAAINKSKEQGQTPIEYKVGEIDNTETCKTTNPIHTMRSMFNIPPKGMRESVDDILNSEIFTEADEEEPQDVTSRIIANVKKDEPEEEQPEETTEEPETTEEQPEEVPEETTEEEPPKVEEEPEEETPAEDPESEEAPPELPEEEPTEETPVEQEEEKPKSLPKQADKEEENKNGVNRKKLYIAFIEYAKGINKKNVFGSIFDKDAFHVTYPYVPHELRYFYRLSNPTLCVLDNDLTFFAVSELKKINKDNKEFPKKLIFASTMDQYFVFNNDDKKVYSATDGENALTLKEEKAKTFDLFIQNLVGQGDILNSPPSIE